MSSNLVLIVRSGDVADQGREECFSRSPAYCRSTSMSASFTRTRFRQPCETNDEMIRGQGDWFIISALGGIKMNVSRRNHGRRHLSSRSEPSILVHISDPLTCPLAEKSTIAPATRAAADDDEDITCLMLSILKDEPFVDFSPEHDLKGRVFR